MGSEGADIINNSVVITNAEAVWGATVHTRVNRVYKKYSVQCVLFICSSFCPV